MITQVGTVCVYVKDQQKAVEFYRDVLGFELLQDSSRWGLAYNGLNCGRREALTTRLVPFTPPGQEDRIGTFSGLVFGVDDIDETYKTLLERGVEFKQKPEKQPWGGILAQFYDVDRNTHVLVQE